MALPVATQTFTASDGTGLTSYNASFTVIEAGHGIYSNTLYALNSGKWNAAYWAGDTFDDNQYAQCKVSLLATSDGTGVGVRMTGTSAANFNAYWFQYKASAGTLEKISNGTNSTLGAAFSAPSLNSTVKLTVSGTTLEVFYDGVSQGTRTDASFASGSAGVITYSNDTSASLDDWAAGNLSSGPTGTPFHAYAQM